MPVRAVFGLLVLLILAAAFAGGCGGGKKSGEEANAPKSERTQAATQPESQRREGQRSAPVEAKGSQQRMQDAAQTLKRMREDVRKRRQQFDQKFKQTPFEKLINQLPIQRPPLYVEQYITTPGSHKLYTAVASKRFFCGLTPRQRALAVQAFYRDASRVFRAAGVKDFVQVVTPQAETTERLPALALADVPRDVVNG